MRVLMPDGCALHVEVEGGGPPLLLVSGFGGLASFWAGVTKLLRDRFRVIGFDHRGRGRSDRPRLGHAIPQLAEDARAILDHLGVAQASVLGHSTGGAVAQALALDAPNRVGRLVLSGSWAAPDAHFRLLFETRLNVLMQAGPGAHARLGHLLGYNPEWLNAHGPEVERAVDEADRMSEHERSIDVARLRMVLNHDRSGELSGITAPTLVIAAEDDGIIPVHHGHDLVARISNARLELTRGGHFFPRLDPGPFVQSVLAHLA